MIDVVDKELFGCYELSVEKKQIKGQLLEPIYTQKLKGFTLQAGYSQMFATDGMYELKNTPESVAATTQNWAWVMLVFKPKFL